MDRRKSVFALCLLFNTWGMWNTWKDAGAPQTCQGGNARTWVYLGKVGDIIMWKLFSCDCEVLYLTDCSFSHSLKKKIHYSVSWFPKPSEQFCTYNIFQLCLISIIEIYFQCNNFHKVVWGIGSLCDSYLKPCSIFTPVYFRYAKVRQG